LRLRPGLKFTLQLFGVFLLAAGFAAGALLVMYAAGSRM
jgi:hypothetical protein